MHEEAVIKVNGMHKFSRTYHGPDSFINDFLAYIPSHFENFNVEPKLMIAEGDYIFALVHSTAEGMQGNFGHLYKIQNGETVEFHILDDSQKLAPIMKAM